MDRRPDFRKPSCRPSLRRRSSTSAARTARADSIRATVSTSGSTACRTRTRAWYASRSMSRGASLFRALPGFGDVAQESSAALGGRRLAAADSDAPAGERDERDSTGWFPDAGVMQGR